MRGMSYYAQIMAHNIKMSKSQWMKLLILSRMMMTYLSVSHRLALSHAQCIQPFV
jgi:hypothetical protein